MLEEREELLGGINVSGEVVASLIAERGPQGDPGPEGFSPTANVTKSGNTVTITITDKEGTTSENINDFSGSYNDLTDKPTIPVVNNATITIKQNNTTLKSFTTNQGTNENINIHVPTKVSDLNNDNGYITKDANNLTYYYDKTYLDSELRDIYQVAVSNIADPYDDMSTYSVGDLVTYQGYLYVCNTDIPVPEQVFDRTHWTNTNIADVLVNKEDISNKVTSISNSSTDTQYPTAKCVYDLVGDIETLLSEV